MITINLIYIFSFFYLWIIYYKLYFLFLLNSINISLKLLVISSIQTIHLALQYFFVILIFLNSIYFFYYLISIFLMFNLLVYSGILWTFSNYYWNNWWVFEDFEEIIALIFNLVFFCYLHFFKKRNWDWPFFLLLFIFFHIFLKILKFPSRHSNNIVLSQLIFINIIFYKYSHLIFFYLPKNKNYILLWYFFFLLPILNFTLFNFSFFNALQIFNYDIFFIWYYFFHINFSKIIFIFLLSLTHFIFLSFFLYQITIWNIIHVNFFSFLFVNNFIFLFWKKKIMTWFCLFLDQSLENILWNFLFFFKLKYFIFYFFVVNLLLIILIFLIWGEFLLLEFYPKNWQASMMRSMHPWLVQMSIWQYWLTFSFLISLTLYFTFLIKTLTYNKADVRIYRSTGEKRRNAWSEILTVIFPFFWSINLISNAFAYLRILEGNGGYTFISVQVAAHQWGWNYSYSNSFYFKFWGHPIKLAYNTEFPRSGKGFFPIYKADSHFSRFLDFRLIGKRTLQFADRSEVWLIWKRKRSRELCYGSWSLLNLYFTNLLWPEVYLYRYWLKTVGVLEKFSTREIKNAIYQPSYTVAAQGCEVYAPVKKLFPDKSFTYVQDKLRLFRASGALVLPTRVTLRVMGTSSDITHSWAVPGLGIKLDCVPGRLFCLYLNIGRDGIYYGQCSELCGWNHYNMPVVVYALPIEHFILWWETALHNQVIENKIQARYLISYEASIYKYK